MSEFYLKVAGVTFEGRQRVIAGLKEGQALKFVPDPSNLYDSTAVKIVTVDGTEVGFVSRDRNSQIFENLMNHRGEYQVSVSSITGGGFGSNYGCNIKVVYTEKSNKLMDTKNVVAAEEKKLPKPKTNTLDFVIQNGRLVEYRASGNSLTVQIPDAVREIGPRVFCCLEHEGGGLFSEWRSIDKILVPNSVTSIGHEAFYQCIGLTSIMLPNSVTSIGYAAFRQCPNLESVVIPDSVTCIGEEAFGDCISLTSINLPDGITDIDKWTFAGCENLKSVKIPDSVTSIGEGAFYGCISLASINLPDGIKRISEKVFSVCKSLKSVVIPDSVTSIGVKAFADCGSLKNIKIPASVTSIGEWAFWGCKNLESIVIPDGVVSIDERAFFNCTSLESVVIPDSVTNIGNGAFDGCKYLVLRVRAESYAETYAKSNNIAFESMGASYEDELETLKARKDELDREIAAIKEKNEKIKRDAQNVPAAREYEEKAREYTKVEQELNGLGIFGVMRKKELKQKLELLAREKEKLRSKEAEQRKALFATMDESLPAKEKEQGELEQSIEELKRQIELENHKVVDVGDVVLFGRYPQTKTRSESIKDCEQISDKLWRTSDGTEYYGVLEGDKESVNLFRREPLQWRVIKKTDAECLLLSEKILRFLPFDSHQKFPYESEVFGGFRRRCFLKYIQSSIRKELTEVFYNEAFSEEEKAVIFPAIFSSGHSSMSGSIPALRGSDNKDVVFLPSSEELYSNLGWYPTKRTTEYAQYEAPQVGYFNSWLTRTMREPDEWGESLEMVAQSYSGDGAIIKRAPFTMSVGIVPALWVDVSAINRTDLP